MWKPIFALVALALAANAQLPELKVEATDGGSALVLKNLSTTQPMTAYLIELVDYPGSSYALSHDEIALGGEPLGPGRQRRIPIANMTVGAAPDYMKVLAAIFADGSSAGSEEKVAQLIERRKMYLSAIRDILVRLNTGEGAEGLKKWADSIPESQSKTKRAQPAVLNPALVKSLLLETANQLAKQSPAQVANVLRANERAILASRPPL